MNHQPTIAAIILAAGAASRMGQPKQLLDWHGKPLVRRAAETAGAANCDPVLVVVGAARDAVVAALDGLPLLIVENPDYAAGQSTSLRAGVAALGPETEAVLVLLGDQPFVTPAIVEQIVDTWRNTGASIVAPVYGGQRGNPVLFARAVFPELLAIEGDQGARAILAADRSRVALVHFDDPRPLADIDTPEDYRRLTHDER
ncbi:MAG TPA: molybdenum cofactor cytidylyltransferase [Roseiflexaceae bacterium]|nr:molybdenum cofactor cytidylyltransferase [Roseiflexaceae bacterium]